MDTNIELKQQQIREWMEKNRKKLSRFSLWSPDLKSDICKDPLFKPLLLLECVFTNDRSYLDYWKHKVATQQEVSSIFNSWDGEIRRINLYIERFGIINKGHWININYLNNIGPVVDENNIYQPDKIWHIDIYKQPIYSCTDLVDTNVYRMCVIEDNIRFIAFRSSSNGDGLHYGLLHHASGPTFGTNEKALYNLIKDTIYAKDSKAALKVMDFLLNAPVDFDMVINVFSMDNNSELFFELCPGYKSLLIAHLSQASLKDVDAIIKLDVHSDFKSLVQDIQASKQIYSDIDIPTIIFE